MIGNGSGNGNGFLFNFLQEDGINQYNEMIIERERKEKKKLLLKYANLLSEDPVEIVAEKEIKASLSEEDAINANQLFGTDEENNRLVIVAPVRVILPTSPSNVRKRKEKTIPTREEIRIKVLREEFGIYPRCPEEDKTTSIQIEEELPDVSSESDHHKEWKRIETESYPKHFQFNEPPKLQSIKGTCDWLNDSQPCHEEIRDFSLSFFVQRSLLMPIRTQCQIVNQSLMQLFVGQHKLMKHLEMLRQFLFLNNGSFGHSLVCSIGPRFAEYIFLFLLKISLLRLPVLFL